MVTEEMTDGQVVGALVYVHKSKGFLPSDADILKSFCEQYLSKGFLSAKQIKLARSKLADYTEILENGKWKPLPVSARTEQSEDPPSFKRTARLMKGNKLAVKFDYKDPGFDSVKDRIRNEVNGRRFIKTPEGEKYWEVPLTVPNIEMLLQFGFTLGGAVKTWYREQTAELCGIQPEGLNGTLMPFQAKDLEMMERRGGKVLLANDMGLGKTITAISYILLHPELRPVLVVVPATLKENWRREFRKFAPQLQTEILNGTEPYPVRREIAIINYDILKDWKEYWLENQPAILIGDEFHRAKNHKALRTKAVLEIAEKAKARIPMTGTPIENRPRDGMNAIRLVEPELVKNPFYWLQRYCKASNPRGPFDFRGASNTGEFHQRHKHVMIRHRKEDVLKDLPPKRTSVVPIPTTKQENNRYQKLFRNTDFTGSSQNVLAQFEKLKQAAVAAKWRAAVDWITNFVDEGQKLGIFVTHLAPARELKRLFEDQAVLVTGEQKQTERMAAVDTFQNNAETLLFVGQIRAAGVGLNLTSCSNCAFLELDWNPKVHDQALDRFHRIGQTDSVNGYYLVAERTVESDIAEILDTKRKIADKATDGVETEETQLITELLKRMKKGEK